MSYGHHCRAVVTITDQNGKVMETHQIDVHLEDGGQQRAEELQARIYRQAAKRLTAYHIFTNWLTAEQAEAIERKASPEWQNQQAFNPLPGPLLRTKSQQISTAWTGKSYHLSEDVRLKPGVILTNAE